MDVVYMENVVLYKNRNYPRNYNIFTVLVFVGHNSGPKIGHRLKDLLYDSVLNNAHREIPGNFL